jgi:hypothetical protein
MPVGPMTDGHFCFTAYFINLFQKNLLKRGRLLNLGKR